MRIPRLLLATLILMGCEPKLAAPGSNNNSNNSNNSNNNNNSGDLGTRTPGDGSSCFDDCTVNARQCASIGVEECRIAGDGCAHWEPSMACINGQVCSGGRCLNNCVNECTEGAKQCTRTGVQSCTMMATGCTDWGTASPCMNAEVCSGGRCVKSCINQCTEGAKQCAGSGLQTCALMPTGCTDWGDQVPCGNGEYCSGGRCVKSCVNQCTEGAKQCSGSGVQTCAVQASACTDWGSTVPCDPGKVCSGGACVTTCTNQCTKDATRCSGTSLQTCQLMPSGCTEWDTPQACMVGTCKNGSCTTAACTIGDRQCSASGNVQECDSGGTFITIQTCTSGCSGGACTVATTCNPIEHRCNLDVVEECNPTGTAWLFVRECPFGCSSGLCTGGCTPGEKRCNGNVVETCKGDGSGFLGAPACTTFCSNTINACAEADLLLDNVTVTLDGEHVYQGNVVLQHNAKIQVGPLGWVRIRAPNINIDNTSSIEAPCKGNVAAGAGGAGGNVSCYSGSCGYGTSTTLSGGGGGYGGAGTGASQSLYVCYYNNYCSVSVAGGAVRDGFTSEVTLGSTGGSCSTPNGGGMIDLIARDSMTISGNLKANGCDGAAGGGGYCGGGSGGGIRMIAEKLTVNGVISAAGAGNGGLGRIKMLYGSEKTIAATTTGVVETSLLPPVDIRSSTHPNPARFYNDGYQTLTLSWTRPFTNLAAYYHKLTSALPAAQNQVPDSTSTYLTGETLNIAASQVAVGQNYFHVVALGPGAAFGTVESPFGVKINSTPPSITSSSHPTQSAWYNQATAVFAWTNPKPDENFTAYHWVFDRYANTVPTKADQALAVGDKALLRPSLPTSTIWYLHLVAQDTMGYLTKAVAHYKVLVGPEPQKGGISGTIRESGSTPPILLDGVKVELNRGLQSVNSGGSGQYFFSGNVYAGSYELRATKDGYQPFVQEVPVTGGNNTSLDIQLVKLP